MRIKELEGKIKNMMKEDGCYFGKSTAKIAATNEGRKQAGDGCTWLHG
jgi:hypothetical protein